MTSMRTRNLIAILASVAAAAVVWAPAASAKLPTPRASQFGRHSNLVTNQWFPLARGSLWVYEGQEANKQSRDVVSVTRKMKTITGIHAAVVADRLYLNGTLAERTADYYAQDKRGTVWYLGENTAELNAQGKVTSREGSFRNGHDGAKGGIFMPANPRVGQSFQQESLKGQAEDRFRILDLATSVTTPAVSSQNAMLTKETSPLEPKIVDHKYYVQGVGNVKEQQVAGSPPERADLVFFRAG
jgi:hypothetical protein